VQNYETTRNAQPCFSKNMPGFLKMLWAAK
jgi:hypothetical protein